jgi:hypothetical protein
LTKRPTNRILTLDGLLDHIGVTEWDVLLVGDGSGVGWADPIGSYCVLIDHKSGARTAFAAGLSAGTITIAEMLPYALAMLWYSSDQGPGPALVAHKATVDRKSVSVHVVSDSQAFVTMGNNRASRRQHRPLWAMYTSMGAMGYDFKFHHVGRDRIALNVLADVGAGLARKAMCGVLDKSLADLATRYAGVPEDVTIYDLNV